jgi:hypothetical protein
MWTQLNGSKLDIILRLALQFTTIYSRSESTNNNIRCKIES